MSLFYIQDGDRPMYVKASNWSGALEKWMAFVGEENHCTPLEVGDPDGISFICEDNEFIE